jgi:hypothetical protein
MIANRSLPVDTLLPHVFYRSVVEATTWLTRTFGFVEHYRYGDPVSGVQMHLGRAFLMLKAAPKDPRPHNWASAHKASPSSLKISKLTSIGQKAQAPSSWRISTRPSTENFSMPHSTSTAITGSSHDMPAILARSSGAQRSLKNNS